MFSVYSLENWIVTLGFLTSLKAKTNGNQSEIVTMCVFKTFGKTCSHTQLYSHNMEKNMIKKKFLNCIFALFSLIMNSYLFMKFT